MSDDRENPYLDPAAREVFENLCATKVPTFDELASVSPEQIRGCLAAINKHAPPATTKKEPEPNRPRHRFDMTSSEGKLAQARADFRTIIGWIDGGVFDAEACRVLCFAAIESLEAKAG